MATRPEDLDANGQQRRYPRTRVVWPATLRTAVGTFDCLVLDLSANGAKIQFTAPPVTKPKEVIEGLVMLAIPRLPGLNATVAWSHPEHGMEMGLTFDDPPGEIATLLASALPNSNAASFTGPEGDETLHEQETVEKEISTDD
ncbi:MAG: PilZ domain-containing protein [Alphaproteobacteria bacterium]